MEAFLTKKHPGPDRFLKILLKSFKADGEMCSSVMKARLRCLVIIPKRMFEAKTQTTSDPQ